MMNVTLTPAQPVQNYVKSKNAKQQVGFGARSESLKRAVGVAGREAAKCILPAMLIASPEPASKVALSVVLAKIWGDCMEGICTKNASKISPFNLVAKLTDKLLKNEKFVEIMTKKLW